MPWRKKGRRRFSYSNIYESFYGCMAILSDFSPGMCSACAEICDHFVGCLLSSRIKCCVDVLGMNLEVWREVTESYKQWGLMFVIIQRHEAMFDMNCSSNSWLIFKGHYCHSFWIFVDKLDKTWNNWFGKSSVLLILYLIHDYWWFLKFSMKYLLKRFLRIQKNLTKWQIVKRKQVLRKKQANLSKKKFL